MISVAKLDYFLVLFVLLITFFVSTIFGIALFFVFILVKRKFTDAFFWYVIFIISLISFTQYSRWSTTNYDMVMYYTVYDFFSRASFLESLAFLIKKGDIFFYFLVMVLSKLFPDDPRMLGFVMPFLTSLIAFFTIKNIKKYLDTNFQYFNRTQILLWCLSFFFILSFPNYTNIYRQYFSISLFFYAISCKQVGKKYVIFVILSALSHWSSIIIIVLYFLFSHLQKIDKKVLFLCFLLGVFSSYILKILPIPEQAKFYLFGNEILGVDKTLIVTSTVIQILLFRYYVDLKSKVNSVYVIAYLLLCYNFFFLFNSTLLTRHFYVVTFFVAITIICFVNLKANNKLLFFPIILLTLFIDIKQFLNGEFIYYFFSKNLFYQSGLSIISSPFPNEIIR